MRKREEKIEKQGTGVNIWKKISRTDISYYLLSVYD